MSKKPLSSKSAPLLAATGHGDNAPPLSVTEISSALKRMVEDHFGHVRLRGEISGFKRAASGHIYLALKDDKSVMDGVMWRGTASKLAFRPEDGLDVVATGRITTYAGRSKYQIVIERLELAGEGALMQLFEKLKARLSAEGLFAPERKKPLPYLPATIGVVTSPTGSVIRDILHRLSDRFPSHVVVWPALVQGDGAAAQIANGVRGFAAMAANDPLRPDVVIVARGGGSIEDLWCFNEEIVVRAIADCSIPVISAVGHETDTTLADYVADRRAPTPTAAAEIAVPVRHELLAMLGEMKQRMAGANMRSLSQAKDQLRQWQERMPAPDRLIEPHRQRSDDLGEKLGQGLALRIAHARGQLAKSSGALRPATLAQRLSLSRERLARVKPDIGHVIRSKKLAGDRLSSLSRLLEQLNPHKPLERGYALVRGEAGDLVTSRSHAEQQAHMMLSFADGDIRVISGEGNGGDSDAMQAAAPAPTSQAKAKPKPAKKPSEKPDQPELF